MLFPPTKVTAPDVMELVTPAVFPEVPITMALCTVPLLEAEMVMLLAPEAKAMLAPATKLTLDELAFNEKLVATGTVGPTTVILLAPELKVMLAPATKLTLEDVPFNEKLVAVGTAGPMIVIAGFVDNCDSVMFDPAAKAKAEEEAVLAVPEVAPPAVRALMDTKADWFEADTVMVLPA